MDSLSTTDLFRVVIANQIVIMGALRRLLAGSDIAEVLQKQVNLSTTLVEHDRANIPHPPAS